MKKNFQLFIALILVLAVVGLASNTSVWADEVPESNAPQADSPFIIRQKPDASSITITESGTYTIGGICNLDVNYKVDGLKDIVDIDVPTDFSTNIPFGYEGDLYLPGCHIVHYKDDEIARVVTSEDGEWKVCFAERPDVNLTVYYYFDDPFPNSQIWLELDTFHEEGFACAYANYTGEYAPGNKVDAELDLGGKQRPQEALGNGSIVPPPASTWITESGTYSVGGICTFTVLYNEPYQTNDIHVADALRHDRDPIDDYNYEEHDEFPEGEGLLYLPGCHVLHYDRGEITHWEKYVDQGDWKICFAAYPDKQMTIYLYLGDLTDQESSWRPLETTIENGQACAHAFFTGVYVPAGK